MDIFEAIYNRRSIRKYQEGKIPEQALNEILKSGMYAPSAVNKQPWHFIVFRDEDVKKKIAKVHPNAQMLLQADLGILVCWDNNLAHGGTYGPVDCAAATQNMLLAAHAQNLGAVWLGIHPREDRVLAVHEIFKLPNHIHAFSIISIGLPGEVRKKPERFDVRRIHYEKW